MQCHNHKINENKNRKKKRLKIAIPTIPWDNFFGKGSFLWKYFQPAVFRNMSSHYVGCFAL